MNHVCWHRVNKETVYLLWRCFAPYAKRKILTELSVMVHLELILVPGFDLLGKGVRDKSGAGGVDGGEGARAKLWILFGHRQG